MGSISFSHFFLSRGSNDGAAILRMDEREGEGGRGGWVDEGGAVAGQSRQASASWQTHDKRPRFFPGRDASQAGWNVEQITEKDRLEKM